MSGLDLHRLQIGNEIGRSDNSGDERPVRYGVLRGEDEKRWLGDVRAEGFEMFMRAVAVLCCKEGAMRQEEY